MTSRKLSESDKQEMLQLYRQPGETTSTLASRYGVSNSTVSRILKTSFSEAEYEALIQTKRASRTAGEVPLLLDLEPTNLAPEGIDAEEAGAEAVEAEEAEAEAVEAEAVEAEEADAESEVEVVEVHDLDEEALAEEPFSPAPVVTEAIAEATQASLPATVPLEESLSNANGRRLRKRSSAQSTPTPVTPSIAPPTPVTPSIAPPTIKVKAVEADRAPIANRHDTVPPDDTSDDDTSDDDTSDIDADPGYDELLAADTAEALMGEDLLRDETDLADELDDDDDDDLEDDDLDDDLDDDDLDDDLENGALFTGGRIAGKSLVQVLPLAEASLPRTCYLVVDRSAELIARPLKEFGDLGQIPEAEVLSKTLPIFDNHRVAKRYSNPRTQRVIKLPDAQVLQRTSSHLQAKGITRLLIDGQVYAL